ncbi:aspartate aminotransferase family protein [Pigmentibacter sp. JX0631]|uniref:aspartate aminotransferase family protein n=1 Tax=Pigmentibacter sp. JX0631 TaxID=2976982 RepID=UPI002468E5E2|nr:aspartate aminotransferase family protein [Pigmentibacter sp. JX0631]WGL60542.1 aspartate aminotransferase family protein [Pigmentibacter sp. JX0631]
MQKSRSRKLNNSFLSRLQNVECPDTTYINENFPIVMKKGKGMSIQDVDNNKYLDFTACFGVLALGHRPQTTIQAIRKQAAKLIHGMGDVHPTEAKINLLEQIAKITPYEKAKSLLGQSGGDAIESAIKTAMLATNRYQFLSFSGGYHGLQFAPLALNHRQDFIHGFEPWLHNKSTAIPFPSFSPDETGLDSQQLKCIHQLYPADVVLNLLEDELKKKIYAALILEPIQGRGGKRAFTAEFLKTCKELCAKYGTLLVFDEIYTGFGRTGKLFALQHFNVTPDLLCLGKAMGGGLPISLCVGDIMEVWEKSKGEARQTQTFLGHPLACAVAYETIKTIQKNLPNFQKELLAIDQEFLKFQQNMQQEGLFTRFPFVIRGKGFMKGIWFYKSDAGFCVPLMEQLLNHGFIVLPEGERADVLSFTPPLIVKANHFNKIFKTIIQLLKNSV